MRRRPFVVASAIALVIAGLSVAAIPVNRSSKRPKINAVRAVADAHVNSASRFENFGRARRLLLDARPPIRVYLRFDVDLQDDEITRVNLLLYSHARSRLGYQVRVVSAPWRERRISFDNAPAASTRFVASGPLRARAWKAVDVTALVRAANEDEVSLTLTTTAVRGFALASRETGITGPRLVVERRPKDETRSTTTQTTDYAVWFRPPRNANPSASQTGR